MRQALMIALTSAAAYVTIGDKKVSTILAIPAVGALLLALVPRTWTTFIRELTVSIMVANFFASMQLLRADFTHAGYHFVENVSWVEAFGIQYKLGVDGISVWLVLLTTLLTPIALGISWSGPRAQHVGKVKEYAVMFLLLQVGMLGAFVALDLFLFYVFWELMLMPMYLVIGIWGGHDRIHAATKFFLYTLVGSLLMLASILYVVGVYQSITGAYTFDIELLNQVVLPPTAQYLCFGAFALAFAIKIPLFPFHTWLPDAYVQAPTGGTVLLAAVLLKVGVYGFIRFAIPMFPLATQVIGPVLAALGVVGILYGAAAAWVQKDLKRLVAYSSLSHMGFVALGLFALTPHGVAGSVIQMFNHGVSTGALFLLVGLLESRRGSRELTDFGGVANVAPWFTGVFVIFAMSSIGMPGTNGFVGEFMTISGAFVSRAQLGLGTWWWTLTLLATLGVAFGAVYMLHAILRVFWGETTHAEVKAMPELQRGEFVTLAPLLVLVFWIGLYPKFFLDRIRPSTDAFVAEVEARYADSTGVDEPRLTRAAQEARLQAGGGNAP